MKCAINASAFSDEWDLLRGFRFAKESGFDGVEVNLCEDGPLTPESTQSDAQQVVAQARSAGIELPCLLPAVLGKHALTSADRETAEKGLHIAARSLQIAAWMGLDAILLVPGRVTPEMPYDTAYDRAQGVIRDLLPEAERLKVCMCVENVWNKFLLSPLEMRRFIDEIGSEYVAAYFDVGNVLVFGYPEQWIRILGPRIKRVHVKDFKTSVGNIQGFTNLLEGDVNWPAVRAALDEIEYDGWVTAEVAGYSIHHELGLKATADAIRRVFK